MKRSSHFSFSFDAFAPLNSNYKIELNFKTEFGNGRLSSVGNTIYSVPFISFEPTIGPDSGNFTILIPFRKPKFNYLNYNITIQTFINERNILVGNCELTGTNLSCQILPLNHLSDFNLFNKLKLQVYINGFKAINLTPYFTFYKGISITKILPSKKISKYAKGYFELHISSFLEKFGKFKVKYKMNEIEIIETCNLVSSSIIICKVPSFNQTGDFSMFLTQGGTIYQDMKLQLSVFETNQILFDGFSPTLLSYSSQTSIEIHGKNFPKSENITVKLNDGFVERISKGIFISDSLIKTVVLPFYNLDISLPRELSISISFDGGLEYIKNSNKTIIKFMKSLELTPNFISINDIAKGIIVNEFPTDIYYNSTLNHLKYSLYHNNSYSIDLNCTLTSILRCDLKTAPKFVGDYKFKIEIYENDTFITKVHLDSNQVSVYGKIYTLI